MNNLIRQSLITGLAVLAVGVCLVLFGAFLAYDAYINYRPLLPVGSDLQSSITNTAYELLNLIIRLGFLGAMIWAGSIILSRGVDLLKATISEGGRKSKEGAATPERKEGGEEAGK